ncbi:MAG: PPC domain-containing protein [Kofleriaceae bacterium]
MKRNLLAICGVVAVIGAGCGDDGKQCGEGTVSNNGVCEPTGGMVSCTNGTKLNEQTGACEIDPASCQDGTVLIDNQCQDPTAGLVVDVTEGDEPNGLGFLEDSKVPAGELTLKAEGTPLVVHGTINPHTDGDEDGQRDPDYDTYVIEVDEPTLLEVSADGLNGLMAAFIAIADPDDPNDPATDWLRYGLNIGGDTSKRQLYLPSAGVYYLAIGDTRSMYLGGGSPPAAGEGAAAGGPDAEYYLSIKKIAIPAPTALTLTDGDATDTGTIGVSETKFFTAAMGDGFNAATLDMPNPAADASLLFIQNGKLRVLSDEGDGASGQIGGFEPGDTALIVADYVYAYGPDPEHYTLTVRTGDADPLCASDCSSAPATATQTLKSNDPLADGVDFVAFNSFYYDVAAADDIMAIDLTWNVPVQGVLLDSDGLIVAYFSYDPSAGFSAEWTEYRGLIRHPWASRYYFAVYAENGTPGTDMITAMTQMALRTPTAVTQGTPTAAQSVDAFESNVFTYAPPATDKWQKIDATGTNTGDLDVQFFDPATAYGRLDALDASDPTVPDVEPIFGRTIPETGDESGRVTLNDGTASYLVTVNTVDTDNSAMFTLDFARRDHHDFGTVNSGTMTVSTTIDDTTNQVRRFLVRAAPHSEITIDAEPTTGDLDTVISSLDADENVLDDVDDNAAGEAESMTFRVGPEGYVAFAVNGAVTGTSDVDITVSVAPPYYAISNGTTPFADACVGGTVIPLANGTFDDGMTGAIAAPANFAFYGVPVTMFKVSTNGWLTFDTSITNSISDNDDGLPDPSVPVHIAPYWDDLDQIEICTKTVGDKLVIQWTGEEWLFGLGPAVELQVIMDPADDSIEFVYGPNHVATGDSATIGVQDETGEDVTVISDNMPFTPAAKKLTH